MGGAMSIAELIELEKDLLKERYEMKLQQLQDEKEKGHIGDMNWLKEVTSINSSNSLKETILYPFRSELEGKIIAYPESKGKPWKVNKLAFKNWLYRNFERIDW